MEFSFVILYFFFMHKIIIVISMLMTLVMMLMVMAFMFMSPIRMIIMLDVELRLHIVSVYTVSHPIVCTEDAIKIGDEDQTKHKCTYGTHNLLNLGHLTPLPCTYTLHETSEYSSVVHFDLKRMLDKVHVQRL